MSRLAHRLLVEEPRDLGTAIVDVLERRVYRQRSALVRRCADAHLDRRARFVIVPRCETCGVFGAMPPVVAGIAFCADCWDVSHDAVDDPYRDTGVGD